MAGGSTSQLSFNPASGLFSIGGAISADSITSSLFGTASWAKNAITALFALNSPATTLFTASIYQITSSWTNNSIVSISSSWASHSINSDASTSSSFASRSFSSVSSSWASASFSSSYAITASFASNAGSSTPVDVWPLVDSAAQSQSINFTIPYTRILATVGNGDIDFSSSLNRQAVKNAIVYVTASIARNLFWNTDWQYLTISPPTNMSSTEALIVSLTCFGPKESDIVASVALTV